VASPNSRSTAFEDSFSDAKKTAYKILSYRDHSAHELIRKLSAKGYSEPNISKVVLFLKETNILNDLEFAERWSRARVERDHFGPVRLRQELLRKGLPLTDVEDQIQDICKEFDPFCQAEKALLSRYKDMGTLKDQTRCRRAFDFLRRKGHESAIILEVFKKKGLLNAH